MEELEAQQVITANAACQIVDGCGLCPIYKEDQDKIKQQRVCEKFISYERVKEALKILKREL